MAEADIIRDRAEILRLRARIVVLERTTLAILELALRMRPEELDRNIELARARLSADYETDEFAPDIVEASERRFLAEEVDRLMRGLQADMGFRGGVPTPERG